VFALNQEKVAESIEQSSPKMKNASQVCCLGLLSLSLTNYLWYLSLPSLMRRTRNPSRTM